MIYGVGCPPYLFHILRNLPREALSVIVIEQSVAIMLYTLASTSVFMALPKGCRISFVVFEDRPLIDEAFAHNITPLGIFPLSEAVSIIHKGLDESRTDQERTIEKRFREEVVFKLTSLGNSPEDTLLGIRHGMLNAVRILQSPSLEDLKKQFGTKPFVCVASGPSLEKNVHLLKDMEDKCVIVACDTVLLPLLRRGIRPHVVTSIERPLVIYEAWVPTVLEAYPEECKRILLLSQSVSHPLIAGTWPGPHIVVGKMESPSDTWLVLNILRRTVFSSGMSVAHMGLSLGLVMDAPSVALIGQDLAYSEDQRTHVEGAVSDGMSAIDQSMTRIEVPGALGGTVQTHNVWLNFLQIFERNISSFGGKCRICDCTEGGALIRGTEVLPLSEYLEQDVVTRPPFAWNPENLLSRSIDYDEKRQLASRIDDAFAALRQCDEYLDRMEEGVKSATAPALQPARRQESAFRVAGFLDDCHHAHPVLSFIGQSYTHLAGASLARNRFMETMEQTHEWEAMHKEIIQSHRVNVAFLRQWLGYLKCSMRLNVGFGRDEKKDLKEELRVRLDSLFLPNGTDMLSDDAIAASEILCLYDPALGECDMPLCWKSARFLLAQGRALEARRIMRHIYEVAEGTDQLSDAIGNFFLDWALVEASSDLCETPGYEKSLELLDSASSFVPSLRERVDEVRIDVLKRQRAFYDRYQGMDSSKNLELSVLEYRNRASEALSRQNLAEAFEWIWKLIDTGIERYPGNSLPNAKWLLDTALNCRHAIDRSIAEASVVALGRLWGKRIALEKAGFRWSPSMMEYLRETGLQVSVEEADKRPEE
jgi:hypothetical protein